MFDEVAERELESLLSSIGTSEFDAAAKQRLGDLIAQHDEALQIYLQHCQMQAMLHESTLLAAFKAEHMRSEPFNSTASQSKLYSWRRGMGMAIAVCAICVLAIFVWHQRDTAPTEDDAEQNVASADDAAAWITSNNTFLPPVSANDSGVAVLTRVAGLREALEDNWQIGQTIPPGSIAWEAGLVQLEFYCGATVIVEGPAHLEILDESKVVCRLGRLWAHVPEPARGFSILAPSLELIDLGTQFGLNVLADGEAHVRVFDGKVELFDANSNRDLATRRELNTGEGIRVDRDGTSQTMGEPAMDFVTPAHLSQMTDSRQRNQIKRWRSHRDSLADDPRVVAFFPFERSDSEDRILSGYGADGTTIEGAIVGCEWSEGRWPGKNSLQFKRPGDRVRVNIPGEYESLTYSVWLRVDGLDRPFNSLLLSDGFSVNGPHWQIRQNGGLTLGILHQDEVVHGYVTDPIFNLFRLGQWVHLATVFDATEECVTHYVNGELHMRESLHDSTSGMLEIGQATIGNWSRPTSRFESVNVRNLNGCIDELIVFHEALPEDEIRQIYEVGRP